MALRVAVRRLLRALVISLLAATLLPASAGARRWARDASLGPPGPAASGSVGERPLADLSPAADTFLAGRAGSVGVAVVVPGQGMVYGADSALRLPLASLAKLDIMLTVLDRASGEGRELTVRETTLLQAMIERSDNDAATALWQSVGGTGVQHYLQSIGLTDFQPGQDINWGASLDTAADVARLMAGLGDGSLLDGPSRTLALVLLSRIDPTQRWGVTAGLPAGALVAFKNGWEQAADGAWRLHSAGVVLPGRVDQVYALVVLTEAQPSLQYGLQTIEQVAALVHAALAVPR